MQAAKYRYTNDLIHEQSPYLLQHAHNPVHWMAWGDKAFAKAKKEHKLIFLSIGYSTCHWCHVMEKETFEDVSSAKILNDNFVSIKVDREERPDIDKYYQDVFYLLNKRGGGWPLTIVMTPERKVIYAGTYLPKKRKSYSPSFKDVMNFLVNKFKNSPNEIKKSADSIEHAINQYTNIMTTKDDISLKVIGAFVDDVKASYDNIYKGIGKSPKFPHASTFDTLLDIYKITKNQDALSMSEDALSAMANGGINDQIEGGFFRYSTDGAWTIPHFEKMLYTNAELIQIYSKLYSIKPTDFTKEVVKKTVENMDERFLADGLYKSASDADSEGVEGKYFVFDEQEAVSALKKAGFNDKNIEKILTYLSITTIGNFENEKSNPMADTQERKPENLKKAKIVLKKLRSNIRYPFIDDKILTSWNSLMASALFEAGDIDEKYSKKALLLVDNMLSKLEKDGILYHQLLIGRDLKVKGLLEDYAFLTDALIGAFEYSLDERYLNKALVFTSMALKKFYVNNTWYLSDTDFKSIAPLEDASYRSAQAVMIKDIYILALLSGDMTLYDRAETMLSQIAGKIKSHPSAYPEAIKLVLISKKGEIDLKGPKDKLSKLKEIKKEINYPYMYILQVNQDMLQACSAKQCFAFSKDAKELQKQIIKYLQKTTAQ
ncbi:MAG: thioredoxin domain-containing protein [Sulfurospirillum sp.]